MATESPTRIRSTPAASAMRAHGRVVGGDHHERGVAAGFALAPADERHRDESCPYVSLLAVQRPGLPPAAPDGGFSTPMLPPVLRAAGPDRRIPPWAGTAPPGEGSSGRPFDQ